MTSVPAAEPPAAADKRRPKRGSYEPLLNGKLAELLTAEGIQAEAETRQAGSSKQIDVAAQVDHLVVALEAEIDTPVGAAKDAAARLEQAAAGQVVADEALAVVYGADLTAAEFGPGTKIRWARQPGGAFTTGTVTDLVAALKRLPQDHGNPDLLASDLKAGLDLAVEHLSDSQRRRICELLELPTEHEDKGVTKDVTVQAAKRGLLVVACAAMFHARLGHLADQPAPDTDAQTGGPYSGPWPPAAAAKCVTGGDASGDLLTAWWAILAVDYRPIFELACRVLAETGQDHRWAESIKTVAGAGLRAARHAAGSRHDLLGRVFHWLLETARYDGSFYTSTPAAALLAGLAIRPGDLPDDLADWRVIDPACGTGTLLMAAAHRVHDLRGPDTAEADAVKLLERSITGLDINATACHMAATTLSLLSPSTQFRQMNIERMPYGMQNPGGAKGKRDPRLGSLELLDPKAAAEDATGQQHINTDWSSGEHIDTGEQINTPANSQHLVIMNPPYTRDSLRYDHLGQSDKEAMKAREKKLMAGRAGHGTALGSMFMDLGEHLADLDHGTLAVVRPAVAVAGPSELQVRKMLGEWFQVEWVVISHDPDRLWFSENTDISEVLIVARRKAQGADARPTKFVRLRRNPSTAGGAVALAEALQSGTDHPGVAVSEWPATLMAEGRWVPLGLTSAHLTTVAGALATGQRFPVDRLGDVALVGPAGRRFRDVFVKKPDADSEGRRALWDNDTELTQTLQPSTDSYIHAKPTARDRRLADSYWAQRSTLMLCVKPRLNTCRVVAVNLVEPTVGSQWVPVRPDPDSELPPADPEQWSKALAAWWNSTPGVLSIIAAASTKVLSRPEMSINAMKALPVPRLDAAQIAWLAAAFDRHSGEPLKALSDHKCPVRSALDRAVAEALGWPAEDIDRARAELAREPSVQ